MGCHPHHVRTEPVEVPFFFFDRLAKEGRCFDKLSTNGVEVVLQS